MEMLTVTLGLESCNLMIIMILRGLIIYASTIIFLRLNKKFLGIRTSYNFILFVLFGSMSATAITSDGLFLPIMATIFILSLINKGLSCLFYHYSYLEEFLVGAPVLLVSNGEIQWHNMKKSFITQNNLLNALQTQLHTNNFSKVDSAYLATDGTINFITK